MREMVADLLITKGASLADLNRQIEGLALMEGGPPAGDRHGPTLAHRDARLRQPHECADLDADPREGIELARAGLEVARRIGSRSLAIVLTGNAAEVAIHTGDWSWADALLDEMADDGLEGVRPILRDPQSAGARCCLRFADVP